ncbi:MAG: SHOCT domain-containing protein, partial [Methylocella sp.]
LQGDKTISINSINAIQLRAPTIMGRGYIRFSINGRDPVGGVLEAVSDENAVLIEKKQFEKFQQLKEEIENRLHAQHRGSSSVADQAPKNIIDELEKLAGLVERGFVTREEFEERKRTVLDGV